MNFFSPIALITSLAIAGILFSSPVLALDSDKDAPVTINADTTDIVWCQEEPRNQGAWYQIRHHIERCLGNAQTVHYAGRGPSAAPAVGYYKLFLEQQRKLILSALSTKK